LLKKVFVCKLFHLHVHSDEIIIVKCFR